MPVDALMLHKDPWAVFWGQALVGCPGITQYAGQYLVFTCIYLSLALDKFVMPTIPNRLSNVFGFLFVFVLYLHA